MTPEPVDPFKTIRALSRSTLENHKMMYSLLHSVESSLTEAKYALSFENYMNALVPLLQVEREGVKGRTGDVEFQATVTYLLANLLSSVCTLSSNHKSSILAHYKGLYAGLTRGITQFAPSSAPYARSALTVCKRVLDVVLGEMATTNCSESDALITSHKDFYAFILQSAVIDFRPKVRKLAQDLLCSKETSKLDNGTKVELIGLPCFAQVTHDFLTSSLQTLLESGDADATSNTIFHVVPLLGKMPVNLTASILIRHYPAISSCNLGGKKKFVDEAVHGLIKCLVGLPLASHSRLLEVMNRVKEPQRSHYWCVAFAWLASTSPCPDSARSAFTTLRKHVFPIDSSDFACWLVWDEALPETAQMSEAVTINPLIGAALIEASLPCFKWLKGHRAADKAAAACAMFKVLRKLFLANAQIEHEQKEGFLKVVMGLCDVPGPWQQSFKALLAALIQANGVDELVKIAQDGSLAWMLPIIRDALPSSTAIVSLEAFVSHFMPMAGRFASLGAAKREGGDQNGSRKFALVAEQVWSCLPSFLKKTSPEDLALHWDTLWTHLSVSGNGTTNSDENKGQFIPIELACTCIEVALANSSLQCREFFAPKISSQMMPTLLFWYTQADSAADSPSTSNSVKQAVAKAVREGCFAYYRPALQVFIGKLGQRLESMASNSGNGPLKQNLGSLLEIAGFVHAPVSPRVLLPWLSHSDAQVQKATYRLLAQTISDDGFPLSQDPEQMNAALDSIGAALWKMRPGLTKNRLALIAALTNTFNSIQQQLHTLSSTQFMDRLAFFLPEVMLALKDGSLRARQTAFELIAQWAQSCLALSNPTQTQPQPSPLGEPSSSNASLNGEALRQFLLMITAGFAGKTAHMQSAALMALTRVLYSYWPQVSASSPDLLDAMIRDALAFLDSPSRELAKSALGWTKMMVARVPSSQELAQYLPLVVPGLLGWSKTHSQHFKVKVRHILERLVKRCGMQAVAAVCPPCHAPLLANLERRQRRALARKTNQTTTKDKTNEDHLSSCTTKKKQEIIKQTRKTRDYEQDMHGTSDSDIVGSSSSESDAFSSGDEGVMIVDDDAPGEDIEEGLRRALKRKLHALKNNKTASATNKKKKTRNCDEMFFSSSDAEEDDDDFVMETNSDGRLAIRVRDEDGFSDVDDDESD